MLPDPKYGLGLSLSEAYLQDQGLHANGEAMPIDGEEGSFKAKNKFDEKSVPQVKGLMEEFEDLQELQNAEEEHDSRMRDISGFIKIDKAFSKSRDEQNWKNRINYTTEAVVSSPWVKQLINSMCSIDGSLIHFRFNRT